KDQAGNETEASSISDTILYQPTAISTVTDTVVTAVSTVTSTVKETINSVKEMIEDIVKPEEEETKTLETQPEEETTSQTVPQAKPLSFWQRLVNFFKNLF
ncbi:hypothetical protein COY87_03335, partial [Candidatus Roizmanbacteria bacterium CG_4_10_14_0_8_um_filter_33_9]